MNGTYFPNANYTNDNLRENNNDYNEQSYIENILKLNKGKKIKAFFSFYDSNEWRDKIFEGILEYIGNDYIIISSPDTGKWQIVLLGYLNFIEFEENINY